MTSDFYYIPVGPGVTATNNLTDKVLSENPEVHAVTEPAQNSRDAARKMLVGSPARLDYKFVTIPYEAFLPYGIETASAHAAACSERDISPLDFAEDVSCLVISDSSGGLDGEVDGIHIQGGSPLEIFGFTSGTGVDGKNGHEGGRHGYGSASFAAASRCRYMLFYSRRRDGSSVASGRLSLPTHSLDGKKYAMESRLGFVDPTKAPGTDGAWQGIFVNEDADELARRLGIERAADDPGLTCIVVGLRDQVTEATVGEQVISREYYQIADGLIEFAIRDVSKGTVTEINAGNISEFVNSHAVEAFRQPHTGKRRRRDGIDRARAALAFVQASANLDNPVCFTDFDDMRIDEHTMRDYLAGKPVFGILELSARHVDRGTVHGKLKIIVQRTRDGEPGVGIRRRGSIVNSADFAGHNTLVISENDEIEVLLGDAEDISHVRYEVNQAQARGWLNSSRVIDTYKNAAKRFIRALVDTESESDTISLAEFFPMPGNSNPGRSGSGADGDAEAGEVIFENGGAGLFSHEYDYEARTLRLVFTDGTSKALRGQPPEDVSFKLEYPGQSRGVGSFAESGARITVDPDTCEGHSYRDGILQVWGITPDFEILVSDVDINRDIDVSIIAESELSEAA